MRCLKEAFGSGFFEVAFLICFWMRLSEDALSRGIWKGLLDEAFGRTLLTWVFEEAF